MRHLVSQTVDHWAHFSSIDQSKPKGKGAYYHYQCKSRGRMCVMLALLGTILFVKWHVRQTAIGHPRPSPRFSSGGGGGVVRQLGPRSPTDAGPDDHHGLLY